MPKAKRHRAEIVLSPYFSPSKPRLVKPEGDAKPRRNRATKAKAVTKKSRRSKRIGNNHDDEPQPAKPAILFQSSSKYWKEREEKCTSNVLEEEGTEPFPWEMIDMERLYFYLVLMCQPKLIQDELCHEPFKLVVATMLLNKTTGKAAIPVFRKLMARWPTPEKMKDVPFSTLEEILHPLGLSNIRAKRLIDLSNVYLATPPRLDVLHTSRAKGEPPTPISHLPGVGKYAIDSWRIFCAEGDEWKKVMPTDKPLCRYLKWKWATEAYRMWFPGMGEVGWAEESYYRSMVPEYLPPAMANIDTS